MYPGIGSYVGYSSLELPPRLHDFTFLQGGRVTRPTLSPGPGTHVGYSQPRAPLSPHGAPGLYIPPGREGHTTHPESGTKHTPRMEPAQGPAVTSVLQAGRESGCPLHWNQRGSSPGSEPVLGLPSWGSRLAGRWVGSLEVPYIGTRGVQPRE